MPSANPRLFVLTGPAKGAVVDVTEPVISIGRESSNALPIPDVSLAKRHCEIIRENDGVRLLDLNSLNGTFVNGVPVKERRLVDGDHIQLSQTVLFFSMGTASVPSTELL